MADFCVAVKMTPSEYRELTLIEYSAFIEAFSESQGSRLEGLL
jgi:hypothetical protein